jgi:hypothetical protein
MGYQERVSTLALVPYFEYIANLRVSVVGLGYEEEFGPYRRVVQHAL